MGRGRGVVTLGGQGDGDKERLKDGADGEGAGRQRVARWHGGRRQDARRHGGRHCGKADGQRSAQRAACTYATQPHIACASEQPRRYASVGARGAPRGETWHE